MQPSGHYMYQQFNIEQLYALPTLCLYIFIYHRINSYLCPLQHKLIGFCNRDEKCLQRGTDWGFKWSCLDWVFKGIDRNFKCLCATTNQYSFTLNIHQKRTILIPPTNIGWQLHIYIYIYIYTHINFLTVFKQISILIIISTGVFPDGQCEVQRVFDVVYWHTVPRSEYFLYRILISHSQKLNTGFNPVPSSRMSTAITLLLLHAFVSGQAQIDLTRIGP